MPSVSINPTPHPHTLECWRLEQGVSVLLLELVVPLVKVDVEDQQTPRAKSRQQEPVTDRYKNKMEKFGINQRHIHKHHFCLEV